MGYKQGTEVIFYNLRKSSCKKRNEYYSQFPIQKGKILKEKYKNVYYVTLEKSMCTELFFKDELGTEREVKLRLLKRKLNK